jgi:hypothetical protein
MSLNLGCNFGRKTDPMSTVLFAVATQVLLRYLELINGLMLVCSGGWKVIFVLFTLERHNLLLVRAASYSLLVLSTLISGSHVNS